MVENNGSLRRRILMISLLLTLSAGAAFAQTTSFTYQGRLSDGGTPATGTYDLQFTLWDASSLGTQQPQPSPVTVTRTSVLVTGGIFTVQLDFGASAFPGADRFLEIGVRPAGGGAFTILLPRQQTTATPYATRSASAATADTAANATNATNATTATNATQLGGVAANQYVLTGDARLTDARPPTAGSTNYIQNQTASTQSAGFNISGNGTVGGTLIANGNVGIGTASPISKLHIVSGSGSSPPRLQSSGTNFFAAGWDFYHGATAKGYVGVPDSLAVIAPGEMLVFGGAGTGTSLWAGGNRSVTINTSGNVGIGTVAGIARLAVQGTGTSTGTGFTVQNSAGSPGFKVFDDGTVQIRTPDGFSTFHACYSVGRLFADCGSAAEYVPTVDDGAGYAQTADLVSIAPTVKNPFDDEHSPFVVTKSSKPCDDNLLGFIVNPESGADGKKLNEHYLPLAIYGYFPAKVTMENGAIKRGDPITSSSKAGYGMKATQACKIVGYALEDAEQEGKIQVFAHLSEHTAPQVAALQAQFEQLRRERSTQMEALKIQNATLEARLAALERAVQGSSGDIHFRRRSAPSPALPVSAGRLRQPRP